MAKLKATRKASAKDARAARKRAAAVSGTQTDVAPQVETGGDGSLQADEADEAGPRAQPAATSARAPCSLADLVARHASVQQLPTNPTGLMATDLSTRAKALMEKNQVLGRLPKTFGCMRCRGSASARQQQQWPVSASAPVVRPPLEEVRWFLDLTDEKLTQLLNTPHAERAYLLEIFSTGDQLTEAALKSGNYSQQSLTWLDTLGKVPAPIRLAARAEGSVAADGTTESVAPLVLRLPARIPQLPTANASVVIVREMEQVVISGAEIYSPIRLWSAQARKAHGKAQKQAAADTTTPNKFDNIESTLLSRRCLEYLYIVHSPDADAPAIRVPSESNLRKQAAEWGEGWWKATFPSIKVAWTVEAHAEATRRVEAACTGTAGPWVGA